MYISHIENNPTAPGSFLAHLQPLPRLANDVVVDLFDPLLEPRGIQLGYVNVSRYGVALFTSRVPARQYHQGLCRQNVNVGNDRRGRRVVNFPDLLREPGFTDALKGVYPTFKEAVELLDNKNYSSFAFDRLFCVERDEMDFLRIFFRDIPVAFGEANTGFKLASKASYLKEDLLKLGVKID